MDLKCDRFLPALFPFFNPQQLKKEKKKKKKLLFSSLSFGRYSHCVKVWCGRFLGASLNFVCNIYCLKNYTRRVVFRKFVLTCICITIYSCDLKKENKFNKDDV